MSNRTTLRLRCDGCDRNLVDAKFHRWPNGEPTVTLTPRGTAGVTDGLDAFQHGDRTTISIKCRCGRHFMRAFGTLEEAWRDRAEPSGERVVRVVLGNDV